MEGALNEKCLHSRTDRIRLIRRSAASAIAESIYALTVRHRLVSFDSATPGTLTNDFTIAGLQAGETLHGIDFRPANGQLYGVSSVNNLYTLNVTSGAASLASTLSTPLNGTAFGVDFNPVVDRCELPAIRHRTSASMSIPGWQLLMGRSPMPPAIRDSARAPQSWVRPTRTMSRARRARRCGTSTRTSTSSRYRTLP